MQQKDSPVLSQAPDGRREHHDTNSDLTWTSQAEAALPSYQESPPAASYDAALDTMAPSLPETQAPPISEIGKPIHTESKYGDDFAGPDEAAESLRSDSTVSIDPLQPLEGYDYHDMYERYRKDMRQLVDEESKIWRQHEALMLLYDIWQDAGARIESHRGSKRLVTQIDFVKQQEEDLSTRRQHLIEINAKLQDILSLASRPRA